MPWIAEEAKSHTNKADTPSKRKKWVKIANGYLKAHPGEEGAAIRIANSSMGDAFWLNGNVFIDSDWSKTRYGKMFDGGDEAPRTRSRLVKPINNATSDSVSTGGMIMAYRAKDHTNKAKTPQQERRWSRIANDYLRSHPNDSETAIRLATSAMGDRYWSDDRHTFMTDTWNSHYERVIRDESDYKYPFTDATYDKDFTTAQRKAATEKGNALPGGGFPINNKGDLKRAQQALGRAKNRGAAIRLIKKRAKELGVKLSPDWPGGDDDSSKDTLTVTAAALKDRSTRASSVTFLVDDDPGTPNSDDERRNAILRARAEKNGNALTGVQRGSKNPDGEKRYITFGGGDQSSTNGFGGGQGQTYSVWGPTDDGSQKVLETHNDMSRMQFEHDVPYDRCYSSNDLPAEAVRSPMEVKIVSEEDRALPRKSEDGSMLMYDTIDASDAKIIFRQDGYIDATPPTARTGIQLYRGYECDKPEMDIVRVYRPPEEVFSKDALRSFAHKPITLNHPAVDVNSKNWKKYAVGHTGDEFLRDGERFRVPTSIMDHSAVSAFKNGTKQLSWGYNCALDWTPGTTSDGEPYDAKQTNLRANHLAIVPLARGGSQLTIGDSQAVPDKTADASVEQGENTMTMQLKALVIDGFECQVDPQSATIINRVISNKDNEIEVLVKKLDAFQKKMKEKEDDDDERDASDKERDDNDKKKDAAIAERDAIIKTKDAEMATIKQQLKDAQDENTPVKIDARVMDRLSVIRKAGSIMGDRLTVDGKTVQDIRRAVVEAKLGDTAKGWDDKMIEASFNTLQAPADAAFVRNGAPPLNQVDQARLMFGKPGNGYQSVSDAREKAYADYDLEISQAWRTPNNNNNNNNNNQQ